MEVTKMNLKNVIFNYQNLWKNVESKNVPSITSVVEWIKESK